MSASAQPSPFDLPALQTLIGKHRIAEALLRVLAPVQPRHDALLRLVAGNPYVVSLPGTGVDLLLQCLRPEAPAAESDWALVGATLHTSLSGAAGTAWPGPWPREIDPARFDAAQARTVFGAGLLVMGPMATVEVPGSAGVDWNILCTFHPSGPLQSMAVLAADAYQPFDQKGVRDGAD